MRCGNMDLLQSDFSFQKLGTSRWRILVYCTMMMVLVYEREYIFIPSITYYFQCPFHVCDAMLMTSTAAI